MKMKKRLFKPTHQQLNGLVLAYSCESDSLAVVPDSTATARVDSLIDAQFREAGRLEYARIRSPVNLIRVQ